MTEVSFVSTLNESDAAAWDALYRNCHNAHPRQHHSFAEVERARGRVPIFAIGRRGKDAVFAGLFGLRYLLSSRLGAFEAVCQRGPLFLDGSSLHDGLTAVVREFHRRLVGRVVVSPYCRFPGAREVAEIIGDCGFTSGDGWVESTGVIELQRPEDELLARVSKSTRYQIRLAAREGVRFSPAVSLSDARCFIRHLAVMHRQRGLFKIHAREFEAIYRVIERSPCFGVFLNAFRGDSFAGGILVLRSQRVAFAARCVLAFEALQDTPNLSLAPALWWKALEWSRASGCHSFDVEGYRENVNRFDPLHNIYESKKRLRPIQVDRLMPCSCELNRGVAGILKFTDALVSLNRKIGLRIRASRS